MYATESECGNCVQSTVGLGRMAQKEKELDSIEVEGIKKKQEMKSWLVREVLALFWVISENSYRLVGESTRKQI